MKKIIRVSVYSLLVLLIAGITLNFYINYTIHHKATQFLSNKVPEHIHISYTDIHVQSLRGNVQIDAPKVLMSNKKDTLVHTKIEAIALVIEDISYIDFLFNKEISAKHIKIVDPKYIQYSHKKEDLKTEKNNPLSLSTKPIIIDAFTIQNGSIHIINNDQDETALNMQAIDITIDHVTVDKSTIKEYIPIHYKNYSLSSSDISLKLGLYEMLSMQHIKIDPETTTFTNTHFTTKYTKDQFFKILPKERDHFNTIIDTITINDFDIHFKDTIPYVSGSTMRLTKPTINVFRDKLLPDDTTVKPLYGTMIREMNTQFSIDKTVIEDGTVIYTEKIKQKNDGGTLTLSNLEGTIKNLGNTYSANQKTSIDVTCTFMKSTPLEVNWQFNSSDNTDTFEFKGHLGNLASEDLNTFIQPNLNVKLDGSIQDTYFSIYGNGASSKVDMRMKYDDLEVTILESNGKEINNFLSSIVNLIIKNDSSESVNDFRKGTATADRDTTKSFFNYMWLSLKAGLLEIIS